MPEIHREYRDRLFCYIFGSEAHKDWTLNLSDAFAEAVRDEADISVRVRGTRGRFETTEEMGIPATGLSPVRCAPCPAHYRNDGIA